MLNLEENKHFTIANTHYIAHVEQIQCVLAYNFFLKSSQSIQHVSSGVVTVNHN